MEPLLLMSLIRKYIQRENSLLALGTFLPLSILKLSSLRMSEEAVLRKSQKYTCSNVIKAILNKTSNSEHVEKMALIILLFKLCLGNEENLRIFGGTKIKNYSKARAIK